MTTVNVDTLPIERPLVVANDENTKIQTYGYKQIWIPGVTTQAADSVSSVTVTNAGTGYTGIPTLAFTGGGGTGAAGVARMKALTAAITAAGTGVVPGTTTLTFLGGTFTTASIATVATSKVVSATIAAAGTGGTPGTQTVTGTTGTGTKFQASVTVSGGGAITAVLSITVAGSYTVNPTVLTAEPVTGASLSGAQLNVVIGAVTATVTTAGRYSVLGTAPLATTGSGGAAGVTVTPTYGVDIIAMTNGGADYATVPTVAFSGGAGSGAAGTAVIGGVDDPITVSLAFDAEVATDDYQVKATPSQACVVSYANKAITGFDVTLTPLTGGTLVAGTVDVEVSFTK